MYVYLWQLIYIIYIHLYFYQTNSLSVNKYFPGRREISDKISVMLYWAVLMFNKAVL